MDVEYAKFRLQEWGDWSRSDFTGLGWPSETLTYRIQKLGPDGASIKQTGMKIKLAPGPEQVDWIVTELPHDLMKVCKVNYVVAPKEAYQIKCAKAGMSRSSYYRALKSSHQHVQIALNLNKKIHNY